jgi:hypothetical protein
MSPENPSVTLALSMKHDFVSQNLDSFVLFFSLLNVQLNI